MKEQKTKASGCASGFCNALGRKKPVEKSLSQTAEQKTLTWYDLTAFGIAATVGSGIYVTCGKVALLHAGPAVVFSILIAGMLSLFTGICYLEFASSLPISGSGYAYFYTMLGEFLGWFIGWNLTLEYAFAAAAIAGGWTQYLVQLFGQLGVKIPSMLHSVSFFGDSSLFRLNILAGVVVILVGFIVSRGVKFGALFTNIITAVNLGIIFFILVVGVFYVDSSNWKPFVPMKFTGVISGAGEMFFSYIGYDTISSLSGDAINPARDLPISFLLTVATATILYMGVGLVLTGMQSYASLDPDSPLAVSFIKVGAPWASYAVSICALFTMAATLFACLMGQPKIFQAIAQDGLLPKFFARENKNGAAIGGVIFTTLLTAALAMFLDVGEMLIEMISFGTLLGMSMLCAGLLVVRFQGALAVKSAGIALTITYFIGSVISTLSYQYFYSLSPYVVAASMGLPFLGLCFLFIRNGSLLKSTSTAFACPIMPVFPCLAIAANSFTMLQMKDTLSSFIQFAIWTVIGLLIYFGYGMWNSHLIEDEEKLLTPQDKQHKLISTQ